jgi:beta-glucosidase/6-phospho-beta-glucosidase/beta-galactosidase
MRNQCRAHVAAYDVLHALRPDVMVGIAHSAPYVEPERPTHVADRGAAALRDFVMNGLPFRLFGRRPDKVLDFIGVNYYTRQLVRWRPAGMAFLFGAEQKDQSGSPPRAFSALGWEIYPRGLQFVLRRFSRYGLPLMVTENGIATDDEGLRDSFVKKHLEALDASRSEGVQVLGYLYWSLMDNFEWTEGFRAKFGLAAVDFESQRRTVRPAAMRFREYCLAQRSRAAI